MVFDQFVTPELKVAIIGYGLAGSIFHAPLIASTPGMRVAGVVTSNKERQEEARAAFPSVTVFERVEDLWAKAAEFDLCVVACPNELHAPYAIAALDAGLHVVVDKPMAVTTSECEQVVEAAKRNGKLVSVFQNRRWDGDYLTVKKLIADGALGSVNRYESRFDRWRPQPRANSWREKGSVEQGAGLLYDLGSHLVDQAVHLFGKPVSVYAEMNRRREGVSGDDDSFIALSFESGVRAHLWMSALVRKLAPRFRVMGMKGTYEKYGLDPQEEALRAGKRPPGTEWGVEPQGAWGTLWGELDGKDYEGVVETLAGDYCAFYAKMRDAIAGGGTVPVDANDAVLCLRIIEAAVKSAKDGAVISL